MRAWLPSVPLTLFALAASSLVVSAQMPVLEGTWRLNVAKSTFKPGPSPKSQTIKWERAQGGMLFTVDQVTADGRTTHGETLEKGDGSEAAVSGAQPPMTRFFKRIDDRTYEDGDKVNGKVTVTRRGIVSQDGKTLTVTMTGTNAQGQQVNNVAIFEKQ